MVEARAAVVEWLKSEGLLEKEETITHNIATAERTGGIIEPPAALKTPVDSPVLFDALDRALRLRLLEERGEGYAFRHPIVRAALYDCLPRHRRDELRAALTAPGSRSARSLDRLPGFLLSSKFLRPSSNFGGGWKGTGMHALPVGQDK